MNAVSSLNGLLRAHLRGRRILVPALLAPALGAVACSVGQRPAPSAGDAAAAQADAALDARLPSFAFTTDQTLLQPSEERLAICEGFALDNDDWIYVSGVTLEATQGVHHSDWFVYPESAFGGPHGSDDCMEVLGGNTPRGGALFSQSTQSRTESQSFGDGAAFAIPPRSQLFVSYHLLNITEDPLRAGLTVRLQTVAESRVRARLTASGGLIGLLSVPPLERSRFYTECSFGVPPDFAAYFMLPHYHRYGTGMRLELVGGTRDGEVVWESRGAIGEALGSRIEPRVDFAGAEGVRFSCSYDNTSTKTLEFGNSATDEMCSFFLQTDTTQPFYGVAAPGLLTPRITDRGRVDGEHVFSVDGCALLPL